MFDSSSKINAMIPTYAAKLGFKIRYTKNKAQKINGSTFETFKIVLASFQVDDKLKKARFFWKTFLLADISIELVLKILFLTLSNANVLFSEQKLI